MNIFIVHQPGSYSDRWIKYCAKKEIPFRLIDSSDTNIITKLEGCDGLLWHWDLNDYKSALFARQLTLSLEKMGIRVFPDTNTSWYYDDKVGQKYLLEAIEAPLVKSYVFYSREDALQWIETATFPKVFKLRSGAGSSNVKLVKNKIQARRLIRKAFGKGYPQIDPFGRIKERLWMLQRDMNLQAIQKVLGGIVRLVLPKEKERFTTWENGYVYFQDFISGNLYDTRLAVVGNRCFGVRRYCRTKDFRASGSGLMDFNPTLVDRRMIKVAFDVCSKLHSQAMTFDFVLDSGMPKIIEISYCHLINGWDFCPGYWDKDLNWYEGNFIPQEFILDDFIKALTEEKEKKLKVSSV